MTIKQLARLLAGIGCVVLPSLSHAVTVNFSGQFYVFTSGPFNPNASFTGSFTLDESVLPTAAGGGNYDFLGAVDNFSLSVTDSVAGNITFTGQDGLLTQLVGSPETLAILLGGANGTIAANSFVTDYSQSPPNGSFSLTGLAIDLRGSDLFPASDVMASGLQTADFNSFRQLTLNFSGPLDAGPSDKLAVSGGLILTEGFGNAADFSNVQFSDASPLPEPPPYSMLGISLSLLLLRRYRRTVKVVKRVRLD